MKKYNIEVINKEVKADDEFDADTIILATGSKQIVPPIQGIDQVRASIILGKIAKKFNRHAKE